MTAADLTRAAAELSSDGFAVLGRVLTSLQAASLRERLEDLFAELDGDDPELDHVRRGFSLMRVFEHGAEFRDLVEAPGVVAFVEHVLGESCHLVAQNALRIVPGSGLVKWHIDDELFFPFLSDAGGDRPGAGTGVGLAEQIGPDLPCFAVSVMLLLSDVDDIAHGPTQFVPGSHRSGRKPEPKGVDTTQAVSMLGGAGEAYAFNSQTWHRGARNESPDIRYSIVATYGRRFISQRFYPFVGYQLPADVLAGASDRMRRLLGLHDKGAYG